MPKRIPPSDHQTELPLFDDPPVDTTPVAAPQAESMRRFLGWDRPVLETVVTHLARDWERKGSLDLSDLLVIVPTRNAGRRLRESLALLAAESNAAVIPPLVTTQNFLVAADRIPAEASDGKPVADRHATRLIWSALLLEIDLDRFRRVFPVDPVERDLTWAMKTAGEILDVRNLLAESGLDFDSAAETLAERDMEPIRWTELADLEALAIQRTEKLGFQDETRARLDAVTSGELPAEVARLVVAATPDLRPVTAQALARLADRLPVEILVAADESDQGHFDAWGRPLPDHWLDAVIDIPRPEESIRQAATATLQAELACDLIGDLENPAALVAVGVPDPEVVAPFEQAAIQRGWSTHDPAGQPVSQHGIYYLVDQTAALVATESFDAVTRLLRCPDFGGTLVSQIGDTGITRFLEHFDELASRCLPDRLDDAIEAAKRNFSKQPELETGLRWVADWVARFRSGNFGTTLAAYLGDIFADRTFSPNEQTHGAFSEVADTILDADAAFAATAKAFPGEIGPAQRFQLLLELIRERHLYAEREPEDIDLQGWLELLWEDAPHLVVTGMNDHVVPEAIIGHAFLPDSARRALGVPDNDQRFARDAYLLSALLAARRAPGHRVDLLFGRRSDGGDPLRPSRLLFQCPDEELPHRTLQFFNGEPPTQSPLAWQLPWKLKPQPLPDDHRLFERLSVTQFKSYLLCPFRFYLQHGLRMEEFDADKTEMDAGEFGTLLHDALDAFAADSEAAASTDPKVIQAAFEREIDAWLARRYGPRLTTPVLIQREAARRRLAWWSEIEAGQRAAGWRLLETETPLSTDDHPFALAGRVISGRIDRIEEHEDGRLRVFDFKTHAVYDSGKHRNRTVSEYHIAPIKRTEDPESFPEWARVENADGKAARWVDLQIPLYRLALAQRFPGREIEAGHIALGPTEAEVVLDVWEGLDAELLESAKACAEGVIEAVKARTFWPPAERLPWSDPFEELLFGEPEESVDPAALLDSPDATTTPSNP